MSENSFIGLMKEADIRRFWPDIANSLDTVPRFDEVMSKDFLLAQGLNGDMQFWAVGHNEVVEIFGVTRVVQYRTSRALQVVVLVGRNLSNYFDEGLRQLERVASMMLCDELEVDTVRSGMSRLLQTQAGFEIRSISLVKKLEKRSIN